ncbi:uncharacterized protein LOC111906832 [Lactuca sativa]|uniref:uncharacterized protein LOC111906832 n=1 Tax=Lactuca sativa TaxID=4236 RepID=UPI000CD96A16|nr:uncharacterized protein LOC111906832 [Lactuca sativa]
MLIFANLLQYLWVKASAAACFTQNRSLINNRLEVTSYEEMNKRKPNVKFFHIFGCRYYIKNNKDQLGKFAPKADEGIFLGYCLHAAAYRVMNKRTRVIEESSDITLYVRVLDPNHFGPQMVVPFDKMNQSPSANTSTPVHAIECELLNEEIDRDVYVQQPPGFEDPKFPNHCYKLQKVVYGLKQAPRAWYGTLSKFLEESKFQRGSIDPTLFRRIHNNHLIVLQIHVDDIIFDSNSKDLSDEFADLMQANL